MPARKRACTPQNGSLQIMLRKNVPKNLQDNYFEMRLHDFTTNPVNRTRDSMVTVDCSSRIQKSVKRKQKKATQSVVNQCSFILPDVSQNKVCEQPCVVPDPISNPSSPELPSPQPSTFNSTCEASIDVSTILSTLEREIEKANRIASMQAFVSFLCFDDQSSTFKNSCTQRHSHQ